MNLSIYFFNCHNEYLHKIYIDLCLFALMSLLYHETGKSSVSRSHCNCSANETTIVTLRKIKDGFTW